MKEIKILIRIDEENNKLGFALERDEADNLNVSEVLKVIGSLDMLKQREQNKLVNMTSLKMRK